MVILVVVLKASIVVALRADLMATSWKFQMALQLGIWLDDEWDPVVVAL